MAGVKKIIESGANIDSVNEDGFTPLMAASKKGHKELVQHLIENNANVNHLGPSGHTPLILAATNGHTAVVKILVENNADPFLRGVDGKTAAELACGKKKTKKCNALTAALKSSTTHTAPSGPDDEKLKALIEKNDLTGLKSYLDEHPDKLSFISNTKLRLSLTGPSKLRVMDIAKLTKARTGEVVIIEQINSADGPYKKFTDKEASILKTMGISKKLVKAMHEATVKHEQQQRQPVEQQQQVALAQQQAQAATPPPPPPPTIVDSAVECAKLAAANKACDLAGGFLAMGCKMLAKAQFSCPIGM